MQQQQQENLRRRTDLDSQVEEQENFFFLVAEMLTVKYKFYHGLPICFCCNSSIVAQPTAEEEVRDEEKKQFRGLATDA